MVKWWMIVVVVLISWVICIVEVDVICFDEIIDCVFGVFDDVCVID